MNVEIVGVRQGLRVFIQVLGMISDVTTKNRGNLAVQTTDLSGCL